jgi:hypothetical protein
MKLRVVYVAALAAVSALAPEPPTDIVCFPDRDFCTFSGFVEFTGKEIRIEVTRENLLIGAAIGIPSGNPNLAFEINHPGGLCWGDKVDLKVTPNLVAGDRVAAYFGNLLVCDLILKDGTISPTSTVVDLTREISIPFFVNENANNVGTKFVDPTQLSARLTNGDFQDTAVGSRHVNAVFGTTTTDPAYTSTITADPSKPIGNYIAKFTFTDATSFTVAKATLIDGFSITMSDAVTSAGVPVGITIFERGLAGGPWSGLCPPLLVDAVGPKPRFAAVFSSSPTTYLAKVLPGKSSTLVSSKVDSHEFTVLDLSPNFADVKEYGVAIPKALTQSLIKVPQTGLSGLYQIRSSIGLLMSLPFNISPAPKPDVVPTLVMSSTTLGNLVTFTFDNFNKAFPIVYTIDGTNPIENGLPTEASTLYAGPETIKVGVPITITAAQYDGTSYSTLSESVSVLNPVTVPEDIQGLTSNFRNNEITLTWTIPDPKPAFLLVDQFEINYYEIDAQNAIVVLRF